MPGLVADSLAVQGNYAYSTDGHRFSVIDLSDRAVPKVVGSYTPLPPFSIRGVAVADSSAYVGYIFWKNSIYPGKALDVGILVLDISDPRQPKLRATVLILTTDGRVGAYVQDIVPVGQQLYITLSEGGSYGPPPRGSLFILDRTRLTSLRAPGRILLASSCAYPRTVALAGSTALIGCNGIQILPEYPKETLVAVDVTDSQQPRKASSIPVHTGSYGLAVFGQRAYLPLLTGELLVADITNPVRPRVLTLVPSFQGRSVVATENTLYLTTAELGLVVLDRATLTPMGSYGFPTTSAKSVALSDDTILVSGTQGLLVLRYRPGSSLRGRVIDLQGAPVPDATLRLNDGAQTTTNAQGDYLFAPRPDGPFTLMLTRTGASFTPAHISGATPYDGPLPPFTLLPLPATTALLPGQPSQLRIYDPIGFSVTVDVPAEAVVQPATLTLTPTIDGPGAGGLARAGYAFDINAEPSLRLNVPFSITVRYSAETVRAISDTAHLQLLRRSGTRWHDAVGSCAAPQPIVQDATTRELRATVCAAGRFVVVGPTQQLLLPTIRQQ